MVIRRHAKVKLTEFVIRQFFFQELT